MNWRIDLSRFLYRLADWMQSVPIFLMRPEDVTEFTRGTYSRPNLVETWSRPEYVDVGLDSDEIALLEKMPVRTGRLLLLGLGGGREAISFAKRGFTVTGVDFVTEMVAQAKANARRHHVKIEGLVQDFSNLGIAPASFDVIWFSTGLYSAIPTRAMRISALKRMRRALRPGGCVVCQFTWDPSGGPYSCRRRRLGALVAFLTSGNRGFEHGDQLQGGLEFMHSFRSEDELRSEFDFSGLVVHHWNVFSDSCMRGAILVNEPANGETH